jgi:hypothetical protein
MITYLRVLKAEVVRDQESTNSFSICLMSSVSLGSSEYAQGIRRPWPWFRSAQPRPSEALRTPAGVAPMLRQSERA